VSTYGTGIYGDAVYGVSDGLPDVVTESSNYGQVFSGSFSIARGVSSSADALAKTRAGHGARAFNPADILGSGSNIGTALYRATAENVWLEDISNKVEGGSIAVDMNQDTPMTFSGRTLENGVLTAYDDWIAPVMTYRRLDEETGLELTMTRQLGLYLVMPPIREFTAAQGVDTIDGRDPLWLLASAGPGAAWSRATGQNIGIAIETVCGLAGVRHAIQTTSMTLPKRRTWPWNATWLQIANDLARMAGFVPLWTDRVGRVRSHKFRKLGSVEPARLISHTNRMVVDQVRIEPDMNRFCNHVVVVGNDPKGNPVVAERLNNDVNSETSTVTLGFTRSLFEEDPNIDDQDAADALADRLIEQGSSVYQRMSVRTMPVLDWEPGDINQIDIETDHGEPVASGRWRWDRLEMGLGADATVQWTMSKLVSFGTVT
jgi:hypothetical protein